MSGEVVKAPCERREKTTITTMTTTMDKTNDERKKDETLFPEKRPPSSRCLAINFDAILKSETKMKAILAEIIPR